MAPNFPRSYVKFQGHTGQKLSETGQLYGFRAFSEKNRGGKGLKFGMLMHTDHRPHSRQVTEARYTEGAARQSTVSSLGAKEHDPKFSVKVFFFADC